MRKQQRLRRGARRARLKSRRRRTPAPKKPPCRRPPRRRRRPNPPAPAAKAPPRKRKLERSRRRTRKQRKQQRSRSIGRLAAKKKKKPPAVAPEQPKAAKNQLPARAPPAAPAPLSSERNRERRLAPHRYQRPLGRRWPSEARTQGAKCAVHTAIEGTASRSASGALGRRDHCRAVGQARGLVEAVVLDRAADRGVGRSERSCSCTASSGGLHAMRCRCRSPSASAGAHEGTVRAITSPFLTGIVVSSGNWAVLPK